MLEYRYKGDVADIQVHLTNHCDHLCRHCYTSSTDGQRSWLPKHLFEDIVSFAAGNPARIIRLVGGEVVTSALDVLCYVVAARDSSVPVVLSTNGYACDVWEDGRLDPCVFREIIVSCYGFEDAHEQITQVAGSYQRTLRTIEYLASRSQRSFEVTVNTLLTRANAERFREFLQYLSSLLVDEVKVLVLSPLGRAIGRRAGYWRESVDALDRQRVREQVLHDLRGGVLRDLRVVWECSGGPSGTAGEGRAGRNRSQGIVESCDASAPALSRQGLPLCRLHLDSMLTIDASGNVYPCHLMINQPRFQIGNLHDEGLSDIRKAYVRRGGGHALEAELLQKCPGCPAYLGRATSIGDTSVGVPTVCPLHLELLAAGSKE